jgi:hypothetical protein
MERTETEKVLQTPVKVTLGGQEYFVKPLPVKYALPWCSKVLQCITESSPPLIAALFFEYARELDKTAIEEVATSAELVAAFGGVLSLELPLLGSVGKTLKALSQ